MRMRENMRRLFGATGTTDPWLLVGVAPKYRRLLRTSSRITAARLARRPGGLVLRGDQGWRWHTIKRQWVRDDDMARQANNMERMRS